MEKKCDKIEVNDWQSIDQSKGKQLVDGITTRKRRIFLRQLELKGILSELKPDARTVPSRKSRVQVAKSDTRLNKINDDTQVLVGNVRTASMAYDAERRGCAQKAMARRLEVLERESKVGAEHFKDITNRWMDTIKIKVPSDLHQHLLKQKSACDAVIQEKDRLIHDLKMEIEMRRMNYGETLDRQEDEMEMTVSRAREQVQLLNQCYAEELAKIESASSEEWHKLVDNQQTEWQTALDEMKSHRVDRLERTRRACDKWERELNDLSAKNDREYRNLQTEREQDLELLEQSLQSLKSALQLNEEKLDYGCQVLRKREVEQLKVKANQKRKMAKLNDVMIALKSSLLRQETNNRENLRHADQDCKRIQMQISNHDKKYRHLEVTDNAKLEDLWRLNDETVRSLVAELLQVDKEICENVLNLPWQPPKLPAVYKRTSRKTMTSTTSGTRHSVRCATLFRIGILATRGRLLKTKQGLDDAADASRRHRDPTPEVRREIVRAMAAKAKFLIDKPLLDMIETFPQDERILTQMDAILSALNVKSDAEVEMLIKFIYGRCCTNKSRVTEDKLPSLNRDQPRVDSETVLKAVCDFLQKRQSRCSMRKALRNVERLKEGSSRKSDLDWKCSDYWMQFGSILPESRQTLWEALSIGLDKLRHVKMEHSKLLEDTNQLQTQNDELKFMLSEYVHSSRGIAADRKCG